MPFNIKKFSKTEFITRTEDIPVPDLKEFFDEGEKPVWTVRNLTGHELGKANEAAQRNRSIAAILEGLISTNNKEKVEAIKTSLGLDDTTPDDIAKRIELLTLGSVNPEIDHETAVRLCTFFPIEVFQLTNKISELTGQGAQIKKKQPPSIAIPESATP